MLGKGNECLVCRCGATSYAMEDFPWENNHTNNTVRGCATAWWVQPFTLWLAGVSPRARMIPLFAA
eukprot:365720-Chlamydomonas_euryale.AAC.6